MLKMREAVAMTNELTVTTERVDDLPMLLAQSERLGRAELLDSYFKPHGNWEGMSLGWTTVIWLTHIVSQGDQRLNQVQGCTGQPVEECWWSDDRLAVVLDALAQPQAWQGVETALKHHLLRVSQLTPQRVPCSKPRKPSSGRIRSKG
jgi:hypothetical protein